MWQTSRDLSTPRAPAAPLELFRQLAAQRQAAIVMVTHDNKVLDIADRIIQLEDGRLVGS
ncbi:MAG: hypothetical protein ACKOE9_07820 [Vulcanococcus sp.]